MMKAYYVEATGMVVVFRNQYGRTVAQAGELVARLKSDYPALGDEDIETDYFGGDKLAGVMYVRAWVSAPLDGYVRVENRNFFL